MSTDATLRGADAAPIDVIVHDLSATGFLAVSNAALSLGSTVWFGVAGIERCEAIVVRRAGERYGCRFKASLSEEQVLLAGSVVTVQHGSFARIAPPEPEPELRPDAEKWPRPVSAALILSASLVMWASLIAGARAVLW